MSDKPGTPKDTHYAKLRRAHRDQKAGGAPAFRPRQPVAPGESPADGLVRLGYDPLWVRTERFGATG